MGSWGPGIRTHPKLMARVLLIDAPAVTAEVEYCPLLGQRVFLSSVRKAVHVDYVPQRPTQLPMQRFTLG